METERYLNTKGLHFKKHGSELITKCIFSNCDEDSRSNEAHLYINIDTGQYHCKKCNARGNLITLKRHFGDLTDTSNITTSGFKKTKKPNKEVKIVPEISSELVEEYHKNIPERIRIYLHKRGINDVIIDKFKIGYATEIYGKNWITIPIKSKNGKYLYFKLRVDPDTKYYKSKYITYPAGRAQIYDWETLKENTDYIVICEGEFDKLVLEAFDIPAITNTHGAGTFKTGWYKHFIPFNRIYICYDNDNAGITSSEKLSKILINEGCQEVYLVKLPEEVGEHGDITDYVIKLGNDPHQLLEEFSKRVEIHESSQESLKEVKRITEVPEPEEDLSFDDWKKVIRNNFPEFVFPAEVIASVLVQLLILDIVNPFSLVLVDAPSSGKTITLNFFSNLEGISYVSDKFTPAAFVANTANVSTDELEDIDLLPKIRYKLFLVRDLATIFSKREEDLNELLGILTRVLDGEGLSTDTGMHGRREYLGEYLFMMVAASTPIRPRIIKLMGNLGARLFFLNMNSKDKSETQLAEQLQKNSFKIREKLCQNATRDFIYSLWRKYPEGLVWDNASEDIVILKKIAKCARLLTRLRTVVQYLGDEEVGEAKKGPKKALREKEDRINQLLFNLCRGHALASGRTKLESQDIKVAIEVALDSGPINRSNILKRLIENGGELTTKEIEDLMAWSTPTARTQMQELILVGLCISGKHTDGKTETIKLAKKFRWFLSLEAQEIRNSN